MFCSQDEYFSLRYSCSIPRAIHLGKWARSQGENSFFNLYVAAQWGSTKPKRKMCMFLVKLFINSGLFLVSGFWFHVFGFLKFILPQQELRGCVTLTLGSSILGISWCKHGIQFLLSLLVSQLLLSLSGYGSRRLWHNDHKASYNSVLRGIPRVGKWERVLICWCQVLKLPHEQTKWPGVYKEGEDDWVKRHRKLVLSFSGGWPLYSALRSVAWLGGMAMW
jgi:hypothetical protein